MTNNAAINNDPKMSTTKHQTDTSRKICNGLPDESLLLTQAEATTTAQNDNNNARTHLTKKENERPNVGQKFRTVNSSRDDGSPTPRPLSTVLLLPIVLLLTTLITTQLPTRTAPLLAATVQWPVTKVSAVYFEAEVSDDHNAAEFRRDETHSPWDVWLQQENTEFKSSLRCTTPRITAPVSALVQWTVTQSGKSVFFDAEERFEYTAAELLNEEVRCPWDVWITRDGRQGQGTKGDLQGVTPRPVIPQSQVQWSVLPSDCGVIFDVEDRSKLTATE